MSSVTPVPRSTDSLSPSSPAPHRDTRRSSVGFNQYALKAAEEARMAYMRNMQDAEFAGEAPFGSGAKSRTGVSSVSSSSHDPLQTARVAYFVNFPKPFERNVIVRNSLDRRMDREAGLSSRSPSRGPESPTRQTHTSRTLKRSTSTTFDSALHREGAVPVRRSSVSYPYYFSPLPASTPVQHSTHNQQHTRGMVYYDQERSESDSSYSDMRGSTPPGSASSSFTGYGFQELPKPIGGAIYDSYNAKW